LRRIGLVLSSGKTLGVVVGMVPDEAAAGIKEMLLA